RVRAAAVDDALVLAEFIVAAGLGVAGNGSAECFELAADNSLAVVAGDTELDLVAGVHAADRGDELIGGADWVAVDARDAVAGAEAHLLGGGVRLDTGDDDALPACDDVHAEAGALLAAG